jgi:2-polyprenyl-3-methyl-5-hydroxy-6-metoxy-1,4-benzoquinol methylase
MTNFDPNTVESFGSEWHRFDQSGLDEHELQAVFNDYFQIVPTEIFDQNSIVADIGCGSGRWASVIAPKVGKLVCFEPSQALEVAKKNLASHENVEIHNLSIDQLENYSENFDFAYSLGVVHHIPDTEKAIFDCVKTVKPGGYCLFYIYYALDNRPFWFRGIWYASNLIRHFVASRSETLKDVLCDIIAFSIYVPFKLLNATLKKMRISTKNIPLTYYSDKSILTLRTDARDRFGTPLEQRFSRIQIEKMLQDAGLNEIEFSNQAPFWCVIGRK